MILLIILVGLGLAVGLAVIRIMMRTQKSFTDFNKKSRNLPMAPNFQLLSGHLASQIFRRPFALEVAQILEQLSTRTFGLMYGSKPCVVTVDLELIRQINEKPLLNTNRIDLGLPVKALRDDCLMTAEDEQWRRIRRAMAPAFSEPQFKKLNVGLELDISVGKLVAGIESRIERAGGKQVELLMDDLVHRFTLNTSMHTIYKQPNLIDFTSERDEMTQTVEVGLTSAFSKFVMAGIVSSAFRPLLEWIIWNFLSGGRSGRQLMEFIKRQTKLGYEARQYLNKLSRNGHKVEDENEFELPSGEKFKRNMIDPIIDQFYEGKLSRDEYFHSTFYLLAASDKTTAEAVVQLIYLLGTHPQVQEKLRSSLETAGDNLEDCQYLDWVIKEALRLFPPGLMGCSRTTKADIEIEGGRHVVPAGTFVITPLFNIHRMPEYWGEDAHEFKPERWSLEKVGKMHPYQYLPFGAGARVCLGRHFAKMVLRRLTKKLLANFRFECQPRELKFAAPFLTYAIWDQPLRARIIRLN